jgi:hypothetical protein
MLFKKIFLLRIVFAIKERLASRLDGGNGFWSYKDTYLPYSRIGEWFWPLSKVGESLLAVHKKRNCFWLDQEVRKLFFV